MARGSGWQHIGAYVNLGSYYIVGIPVALLLGFVLDLKGKGLWSGLVAGATVQSFSLSLITALTNWEKQVYICHICVIASFILPSLTKSECCHQCFVTVCSK